MIVEVRNISKSIGSKEILHDVSFELEIGRTFALLGPNGAGKTTIVRLITGLLKPTRGQIKLFGTDVNEKNSALFRKKIGVQNDGNLYENLTVYQNLDIWGQLYELEDNVRKKKIQDILLFFGLENRMNSKVGQLSKGMRQKVSIARAVFHNPDLLILDEPTSGLDPQSTEDLIFYLKKLVASTGISIIMCTHQLQGLEEIADDIGIIQQGYLTTFGNARQIISKEFPKDIYEIGATPTETAMNICKKYGDVFYGQQKETFKLSITGDVPISQIIKHLVNADVEINTVFKIKHTIKDAYFKIVGEKKND